jgi:hypothetical protein
MAAGSVRSAGRTRSWKSCTGWAACPTEPGRAHRWQGSRVCRSDGVGIEPRQRQAGIPA